jgi:hypothetical protein
MQKEYIVETPTLIVKREQQPLVDKGIQGQATAELGGVKGPEPTRYGDWEKNGRCVDF